MHPDGCLRDSDPTWAHDIVDQLYFSAMRRFEQINAAEGLPRERVEAIVLAKNGIGIEEVRHAARDICGHVPELISDAAIEEGNRLMSRIIMNAGTALHAACETQNREMGHEDTETKILIRVTRDSISVESVYETLSHNKPIFQE